MRFAREGLLSLRKRSYDCMHFNRALYQNQKHKNATQAVYFSESKKFYLRMMVDRVSSTRIVISSIPFLSLLRSSRSLYVTKLLICVALVSCLFVDTAYGDKIISREIYQW